MCVSLFSGVDGVSVGVGLVGVSVVVPPAHDLLACGPEQDGVLELGSVAALGVTEGRVGVYDAQITQVLQSHQVLALAQAVQPAPAEGQCAKVLVDHVQQVLRSGESGGGGDTGSKLRVRYSRDPMHERLNIHSIP